MSNRSSVLDIHDEIFQRLGGRKVLWVLISPNIPFFRKAVFWSGLNQITCINGQLKPDFFEIIFQVPGEGEGGGRVS